MEKSANISTLNKRLTRKVLSGDADVAMQGIKYYVSQTSREYWKFLIKPVLYSGSTSASGQKNHFNEVVNENNIRIGTYISHFFISALFNIYGVLLHLF